MPFFPKTLIARFRKSKPSPPSPVPVHIKPENLAAYVQHLQSSSKKMKKSVVVLIDKMDDQWFAGSSLPVGHERTSVQDTIQMNRDQEIASKVSEPRQSSVTPVAPFLSIPPRASSLESVIDSTPATSVSSLSTHSHYRTHSQPSLAGTATSIETVTMAGASSCPSLTSQSSCQSIPTSCQSSYVVPSVVGAKDQLAIGGECENESQIIPLAVPVAETTIRRDLVEPVAYMSSPSYSIAETSSLKDNFATSPLDDVSDQRSVPNSPKKVEYDASLDVSQVHLDDAVITTTVGPHAGIQKNKTHTNDGHDNNGAKRAAATEPIETKKRSAPAYVYHITPLTRPFNPTSLDDEDTSTTDGSSSDDEETTSDDEETTSSESHTTNQDTHRSPALMSPDTYNRLAMRNLRRLPEILTDSCFNDGQGSEYNDTVSSLEIDKSTSGISIGSDNLSDNIQDTTIESTHSDSDRRSDVVADTSFESVTLTRPVIRRHRGVPSADAFLSFFTGETQRQRRHQPPSIIAPECVHSSHSPIALAPSDRQQSPTEAASQTSVRTEFKLQQAPPIDFTKSPAPIFYPPPPVDSPEASWIEDSCVSPVEFAATPKSFFGINAPPPSPSGSSTRSGIGIDFTRPFNNLFTGPPAPADTPGSIRAHPTPTPAPRKACNTDLNSNHNYQDHLNAKNHLKASVNIKANAITNHYTTPIANHNAVNRLKKPLELIDEYTWMSSPTPGSSMKPKMMGPSPISKKMMGKGGQGDSNFPVVCRWLAL